MWNQAASISAILKPTRILFALSLVFAAHGQPLSSSQTGGLRGTVFTIESNQERTFVPGAPLRIQCAETGAPAVELTTDEIGRFSVAELPTCQYRITVNFPGMEAAPLDIVVQPDKVSEVEIELKLATVKEASYSLGASRGCQYD